MTHENKDFLVEITIPGENKLLEPTQKYLALLAQATSKIPPDIFRKFFPQLEAAVEFVWENQTGNSKIEPITISVNMTDSKLLISITNRGAPILIFPEKYANILADFQLLNFTRNGQTLQLAINLPNNQDYTSNNEQGKLLEIAANDIIIRDLIPGEEEKISDLFFQVYGYQYINTNIYNPSWIRELISEKRFVSIVAALRSGEIIGHLALVQWNPEVQVYEAACGVTDPRFKSSGLFKRIFEETMERAKNLCATYTFFDTVCNHDFSQRLIARTGGKETALIVGCQTAKTQASLARLGIGEDPDDMYRYSLLYMILPGTPHPFGEVVELPLCIGEAIGFLLDPIGMRWIPSPRFAKLANDGCYLRKLDEEQGAVYFDFREPAFYQAASIVQEWRDLLREGYEFAAVDVPVGHQSMGALYQYFSENGFFLAGFIPYQMSHKLAIRFQAMAPTKVAFDRLKIHTDMGKRLLAVVRSEYERCSGV